MIENIKKPKVRKHEEFLRETRDLPIVSDELLFHWDKEGHSVSHHLLLMYSIVRGMRAKQIMEVGFGRSSKVFIRSAIENEGEFHCCDTKDVEYLFSNEEKQNLHFFKGFSTEFRKKLTHKVGTIDFAFLDYFSGESVSLGFCFSEFIETMKLMRPGGIICVHDVSDERYSVSLLAGRLRCFSNLECIQFPYHQGLLVVRVKKHRWGMFGWVLKSFFSLKSFSSKILTSILYRIKNR